jgi:putative nucleotidyltransferase with HDIG domain
LREFQLKDSLKRIVESKSIALDSALKSLESQRDMTLEALVKALDAREKETRCHSLRVQRYSLRLTLEFDIEGLDLTNLGRGALLHDIGKIGISDAILLKPGKLTEAEWIEMKKHPALGFNILTGIQFLEGAADLVLHHHERYDGKGYPVGLKADQIPFGARLFSVVDTFDAMTSDRPYRKALSADYARQEIRRQSGHQFDPEIVRAFLRIPQYELEQISLECSAEAAQGTQFAEWVYSA